MPFTVTEQLDYDPAGNKIVDGYRVDKDGQPVAFDLTAMDASILADALNVHEATGLTPSQLQARVAELEAARVTLVVQLHEALDQIERTLHLFRGDAEGRKQAEGCIEYARKVTTPFNYNGGSQ